MAAMEPPAEEAKTEEAAESNHAVEMKASVPVGVTRLTTYTKINLRYEHHRTTTTRVSSEHQPIGDHISTNVSICSQIIHHSR